MQTYKIHPIVMGSKVFDKSMMTYQHGNGEVYTIPIYCWYLEGGDRKVLVDTGEIGTAGAGLTNVGNSGNDWNTVVPDAAGVAPTTAEIADAVWDETMVGHGTADTAGLVVNEWQDAGRLDAILDTIAADVVNVDGYNLATQIGTAGAGLTNVGNSGNDWNTVVPDAAGTAPTAAEIETEVWDALQSAHVIADSMGAMATEIASIQTDTTAIEADTQDLQTQVGTAGAGLTDVTLNAASIDLIWDEDIVAAHNTADTSGAILNNILPEKNAAFSNIEFLWVAASDHVTPVTGATTTSVTRSIDGGAFGSGTGTLAEVGNGIYQYDASQADMNGTIITFRFVATGGTPGAPDDAFLTIKTSG